MRLLLPIVALVLAGLAAPAAQAQSLYADPVARRAGDLLTVVLAERTAAQRRSSYEDDSRGSVAGSASSGVAGRFGLDAQVAQSAATQNRTAQSDLLDGTVTVVVKDVDPAGNLVVEGERTVDVNGVSHRLRVAGLVRPSDVRAQNTVLSFQIANAEVAYTQVGGIKRRLLNPGTVVRAGLAVLIGAAVFAGASAAGGS